ncbi:MAG: glucose 1-dehydrogenase [Chloroflexi bacterium]|nr:MAG: glucose 1-dehydrogenase [Chloroflexota bacterium]TMG43192.1 MAG: glucose 1-dehydrogenase [Chloroflexota bacterium]
MFSFEGKKALVTGGGRGIGRAIALAFARQGADVALAARGRDELDAVAGEIRALGRKAFIHVVDLADTDRAVNMVNAAAGELGSLDILVNNAGGITEVPGSMGPLAEATVDAFDAMYALNVRTPLFAAVAACRLMSRQGNGGAILNIVSIDALFPAPTEGIYGSAKAAVVNLTKVLAYEAGKDRIRVNAIAPGVIDTRLTEQWLRTEDQRADRASFYPLNRVGIPDDIAGAAVYLCSDEAEWVSGNVLYVTGGQLATSDVFRWVRAHNPVPDSSKI